ncbi:hypothetical protein H6F50_12190 [Coleofasciculus sp. FACHB-712]|uniref:NYN domain-containing protein n=1 Tax=Coleofasciculus sp. FACHB-712 TaxID=2692789 RepID=UPI001685E3B9|nr:NYN domain-containing protein [Coleofasciculus sp. FACHB-712]MBD1943113.1 hypothetical protein [Coleofasciculus sp. FACHB-712]
MPDNVRATSVNDSTVINEISSCIYQTIIFIQKQQPKLLTEKYRKVPWSDAPYQSSFLLKLQTEFNKAPDRDTLIKTVQKLLRLILTPQCLELPISSKLIEKLRILIDSASEIAPRNGSAFSHPLEAPRVLIPEQHIAILLLDAENLQLDTETEKFLTTVCTYFIQVKIAFANWRRMGKLDAELHERGYDLIHVPAGRDNADGKMIAVGLSIREHYPKVKEVLVCSSDTVMTNLCNHLQKYGLTVYRVFRQGSNITVSNYKTGKIETYTPKDLPVIPPLMQCISYLKSLLVEEQERAKIYWVKLSVLSQLFYEKHKITINQIVDTYSPGKTDKDIFIDKPLDFVVHQLPETSEVYITLFKISQLPKTTKQDSDLHTDNIKPEQQTFVHLQKAPEEPKPEWKLEEKRHLLSSINSLAELENAVLNIIQSMQAQSLDAQISIGLLGGQFSKVYGQSPTALVKKLKPGTNFTQFLQSCSTLKVEKNKQGYWVAIAHASSSKINSCLELEQVLLNMLNSLASESLKKYIPLETLGSEFHKKYNQSVSEIIKYLKFEGSFSQFLKSCSCFNVEKINKGYQVAIAQNS